MAVTDPAASTNPGSSALAIRLLGPFDVRLNGEPLPRLRSLKGQWLLALLVLRHGAEVERSWLAGLLWPDSPEPQALANLRNCLTDLRRALGPEAARLRSPGIHTLSLDLSAAEADVLAFDAAIARGDPAALEEAVALYRGPLLEGCAEEWAFQERQVREQAYLAALEQLAAEAARRGDPAAAERCLRRAVGVDPTRESAQRALIQALAESGNYAAAVQAYRELRLLLHRELNAEPDPATRALFERIRAEARGKAVLGARSPVPREGEAAPETGHRAPGPERSDSGHWAPGTGHGSREDTVTFLFTEIEGSTRLWEEHPDAMRLALPRHEVVLRDTIETNNGRVFKTMGDAFCAAFTTPTDALDAALAAQLRLRQLPPSSLAGVTGLPQRVRMALHTGAAEQRDGDYFGPALNRVARMLAVAHGGQILLSAATQVLVQDDLPRGATLRDMGVHRLRDLQRPEQIFQLLHPDLPGEFPPLSSLNTLPNNLPLQVTSFVGREQEIAAVKRLLVPTEGRGSKVEGREGERPPPRPSTFDPRPSTLDARLVTITGAGGTGKTRLALQAAAELLEEFADGVWLVELASLSDPALVPQSVAAVLGVHEENGKPLTQSLVEFLRDKRLLLALDNCEHLLQACALLADTLLRGCPELRILATSRQVLNIPGETTYRLPSLALPNPSHWSGAGFTPTAVSMLLHYEAVRLFVERAAAAVPSFTVTDQNALAVAEVCSRLDGIPLAIELAAARVRALPVEKINERLDDRFRLLTSGSRTALPRQQTLRAMMDWSYDLLSPEERALLRRLSVFTGGFTLDAAEAVCGDDQRPTTNDQRMGQDGAADVGRWSFVVGRDDVLDLLTALVEKSLAGYEERQGEARYRLLETVAQYGRERLEEVGETVALRARHAEWFLALAERATQEFAGPSQGEWLDRLEMEHGNLRLAFDWFLAVAGEASPVPAADPERCKNVEAALRLAGALWVFWLQRGYLSEGRERLVAVLSRRDAAAPTPARAKALHGAGTIAYRQGDYAAAQDCFAESLTVCRALGDRRGEAVSLQRLGLVAAGWQNDYAAARAYYEESLAIRRELGDRPGIADILEVIGNLERLQGRHEVARALYEESLALFRDLGNQSAIAVLLDQLGNVAWHLGEFASSRALHEESLRLRKELGHRPGIALALFNLGEVARSEGDFIAARPYYMQSLALQRELGDKRTIAHTLNSLGDVHLRLGEYEAARPRLVESLTMQRDLGNKLGIAEALESLARLEQALGQSERAVRLWGAAEALRAALAVPLPRNERDAYDRSVAAARAALGEEAFAAEWAAGQAMTPEQAAAHALGEDEVR